MSITPLRAASGTTSLELSAKGSGSDVRSWVRDEVGRRGARPFINNIAEPLGKALEPLDSGLGLIKVLLTQR